MKKSAAAISLTNLHIEFHSYWDTIKSLTLFQRCALMLRRKHLDELSILIPDHQITPRIPLLFQHSTLSVEFIY